MKKKKKIIITGISGQDANFLIDRLNNKFDIIGLTRNRKKIFSKKKIFKVIPTNYSLLDIKKIIKKYKPVTIYNMAGQSNPNSSWTIPSVTIFSIVNITLNFLEAIISIDKKIKFFNCSTSEIYSKKKQIISEKTKIEPENPYACAKACSHNLVQSYRLKYKIFAVNGILFNHESSLKDKKFLLKKLIMESIKVLRKKQNKIILQSKYHIRDISHAKDSVDAIIKIMNSKYNEDFIIASGISRSISEICNIVCNIVGISFSKISFMDNFNKKFTYKIANNSKIKKKVNWKPKYSFEKMIKEMVLNESK